MLTMAVARRGWLGWAMGLAVVGLALGGWGLLGGPSAQAQEGGGEFQPRQEAPQIDIILVPEYLYADATAAVPVKFKFIDMGGTVEVGKVEVKFVVDGALKIFKDYSNRFAKDDGFGEVGNGQSDTYTVWVPISDFKPIEVEDDLTDNCFFLVHAKARPLGETEWEWFTSAESDPDAKPEVFGDASIEVVEIGKDDGWSPIEVSKLQYRPDDICGVRRVDHVDGIPCRPATPYPHDTEVSCCMWQGYWDHMGAWSNWSDEQGKFKALARLTEDDDGDWPAIYPRGTDNLHASCADVKLGTWFGVSWPHKNVYVISGPGMDLDKRTGKSGMTWFPQGKINWHISGLSEPESLNVGGVAVGVLTVAWGLACVNPVPIVLGVSAGLAQMMFSIPITESESDAAEVAAYFIYMRRPPSAEDWLSEPLREAIVENTNNDMSGIPRPMNKNDLMLEVGESYLFVVSVSAEAVEQNGEDWPWVQEETYAWLEYESGVPFTCLDPPVVKITAN